MFDGGDGVEVDSENDGEAECGDHPILAALRFSVFLMKAPTTLGLDSITIRQLWTWQRWYTANQHLASILKTHCLIINIC